MGEFQRSPSKVWWAGEETSTWRATSGSPGSQDSGFSDTETSPHLHLRQQQVQEVAIAVDLLKSVSTEHQDNLSVNVVEKSTPQKSMQLLFAKSASPRRPCSQNTPVKRPNDVGARSEPAARYVKNKTHPRVNRNLFRGVEIESTMDSNQYARDGCDPQDSIGSEVTSSVSWLSNDELPDCAKTLPLVPNGTPDYLVNLSAPAALFGDVTDDEAATSFNRSGTSSDCDSELECLFRGTLDSPKHTSTPVTTTQRRTEETRPGRARAMNLLQKYRNERIPPMTVDSIEEGTALARWVDEVKRTYDSECVITLQCKSIAGELAEKVSQLAAITTSGLTQLLYYNSLIEKEFDNLKNQKKHRGPLIQSLVGIILEFLSKLNLDIAMRITCEQLKTTEAEETEKLTAQLHMDWNSLCRQLLLSEVKYITKTLEAPNSELDVRARLTGLTSVALRNDQLIEMFITSGAIQVVTTLCEKCDGSSVRGLALRALSTLCVNAAAIRKFESSEGVQMLAEILTDESKPEPERTEAIALLAQITAPWIEDNHNIQGLHRQSKRLVKYLTKTLSSTRCCQTVLLCTAALANLTAMDSKSIKYLLHNNTACILLETVKSHGARASIYLLEQVATLIANMSSASEARMSLTRDEAPVALICFLQSHCMDDEVIKRLQQKSMVGLSRLCGEVDAAKQVVAIGGVERLVKLCREKKERYDSDAILVAALATLRKIAEACGVQVVNEEDAQELIRPRLLDSFMAYSAQNESLV